MANNVLKFMKKNNMNKLCVDCRSEEVSYASVNNGVLICFNCADKHRRLGHDISFVVQLDRDCFDEYLASYMDRGGNLRFNLFLDSMDILYNEDISIRYRTKGAEYYRKLVNNNLIF